MYNITQVTDITKHSAAHILAAAITKLYPRAKIGIGPVTKEGFFYDFDISRKLTEEDIPKIESAINQIIQANLPFQQIILNREDAINTLLQRGQIYKSELINSLPDEEISFFKTGDIFIDMCRGPHLAYTGMVGPIKIINIEETNWNDDETRPKLQRIQGVVFNTLDDLNNYYKLKEEEKERNYFKLTDKHNLGISRDKNIFFTEKGTAVIQRISNIIDKNIVDSNYKLIYNQKHNANIEEVSELLDKAYSYKNRSYKELPVCFYSTCFINEPFFKEDTYEHEIRIFKEYYREGDTMNLLQQIVKLINIFKDLKIKIKAEILANNLEDTQLNSISNILQRELISHTKIISEKSNEVRLNFKAQDLLKREWNLASLFIKGNIGLKYNGADNRKYDVFSIEYIVNPLAIYAFMMEENKGMIPQTVAPNHIVCIPINKKYYDYADKVINIIKSYGYLCYTDKTSKSLKRKIYHAEKSNIPLQIIVGEKEKNTNAVSVRHDHKEIGLVTMDEMVNFLGDYFK